MKRTCRSNEKRTRAKSILRLPDLDVAKSPVLYSLSLQRGYQGYVCAENNRDVQHMTGIAGKIRATFSYGLSVKAWRF